MSLSRIVHAEFCVNHIQFSTLIFQWPGALACVGSMCLLKHKYLIHFYIARCWPKQTILLYFFTVPDLYFIYCLNIFLDHERYLKHSGKIMNKNLRRNIKGGTKNIFYDLLEFNSVLVALYSLVGIWGIAGMNIIK